MSDKSDKSDKSVSEQIVSQRVTRGTRNRS